MSNSQQRNNFPKLHNAAWPGLVGKGPDSEPPIGSRHDARPDRRGRGRRHPVRRHRPVPVRSARQHRLRRRELKRLAEKVRGAGTWPSARSSRRCGRRRAAARRWAASEEREQVSDAGAQGLPHRPEAARAGRSAATASCGSIRRRAPPSGPRIRTANTRKIADTFREACDIADGLRRTPGGGGRDLLGRHALAGSEMVQLLELVDGPRRSASRRTWPTRCSITLGYNAPEDAHPARRLRLERQAALDEALKKLTAALRPWTIDFHVAQNDATVKGSGSHDKTGRHCLATDPNGKLDIAGMPASGCATTTATRPRRSRTSAGTAACSRTR